MAVTPGARDHLLAALRQVLDPEAASTMAEYLNDEDGVVARFDQIDATLADHAQRFDQMDTRLDGIDQRLDGIDQRLDGIDQRLDGIDQRFDRLEERLEHGIQLLRFELVGAFRGEMNAALHSQMRMMLFGAIGLGVTVAGTAAGIAQIL